MAKDVVSSTFQSPSSNINGENDHEPSSKSCVENNKRLKIFGFELGQSDALKLPLCTGSREGHDYQSLLHAISPYISAKGCFHGLTHDLLITWYLWSKKKKKKSQSFPIIFWSNIDKPSCPSPQPHPQVGVFPIVLQTGDLVSLCSFSSFDFLAFHLFIFWSTCNILYFLLYMQNGYITKLLGILLFFYIHVSS